MADRAPQTWLVIFDPTLRSLEGHSHNYDHAVATAAAGRFDHVVVCAERAFAQSGQGALPMHPIEVSSVCLWVRQLAARLLPRSDSGALPNAPTPGVPSRLNRPWLAFRAYEIATSLDRTLRSIGCRDEDLVHVFIQHADHYEIAGAERFLRRHGKRAGRITLHLFLRHDPDITRSTRESAEVFAARLLRLSRAPIPAVRFMTDSEIIAAEYRTLTEGGMPIRVVPIPVVLSAQPQAARDHADSPSVARISILGASRMEKGFGSVIELLSRLPARLGDARVHFAVQVNRASSDPNVRSVIERLDAAAGEHRADRPVVEILEGPATEAEYAAWFRRTHILLMPYASPKYRASTSSVFVEAMHFGVPCVVAADTWMASQVEEASRRGMRIGTVARSIRDMAEACAISWAGRERFEKAVTRYAESLRTDAAAGRIVDAIEHP